MKFFDGCTNADDAKKIYRQLAKCFHPDKGGSLELMTELQKQYESWDAPAIDQNPFIRGFQTFTPDNFGRGYRRYGSPLNSNLNQDAVNDITNQRLQTALRETEALRMHIQTYRNKLDYMDKIHLKDSQRIEALEREVEITPSRKKIWEELQEKRHEVNQCYATILELKAALESKEPQTSIIERIKGLIFNVQ